MHNTWNVAYDNFKNKACCPSNELSIYALHCLAQRTIFPFQRFFVYYDLWWSCQHVVFVWISSLILLMKYLAPLPYCDSLHKCAAHLGGWEECDEEDEIPDNPKEYVA